MGLTTIFYAIIIFCLLILVHEAGHFFAAKAVGVKVNEFSLGMGPSIFSYEGKDTTYSIRALPIGGYVSMEGEDEDSDDPRAFNNKNRLQKAFVLVAGSFMNFITAVILIAIIALTIGMVSNVIDQVHEGYPAESAGLLAGDRIVEIDGKKVNGWEEITEYIAYSEKDEISLKVKREGQIVELKSGLATTDDGRRVIGIVSRLERSPGKALKAGVVGTVQITKEMLGYLKQLFTGKGSMEDLVGPVGIVSIINDQAKLGLIYIVNLTALISLNLAIVNMLPFPALDGGRLLILLIGAISRRDISEAVESRIHYAGLILLFGLMIYLVFHDVNRFILP